MTDVLYRVLAKFDLTAEEEKRVIAFVDCLYTDMMDLTDFEYMLTCAVSTLIKD